MNKIKNKGSLTSLIVLMGLLLFGLQGSYAQVENQLKIYNQSNGLSNDFVHSILEDYQGYIWFGTESGLNRFDGYQFYLFQSEPGNPQSLSGNFIWALFEDSSNRLWVGSEGGLDFLIPGEDHFQHFQVNTAEEKNLSFSCSVIFEGADQTLWVSTDSEGLLRIDLDKLDDEVNAKQYSQTSLPSSKASNDRIKEIFQDSLDNLLLIYRDGVTLFDPHTEKATFYALEEIDQISSLYERFFVPLKDGKEKIQSHRLIPTFGQILPDASEASISLIQGQLRKFKPIDQTFGPRKTDIFAPITDAKLWINHDRHFFEYDIEKQKLELPKLPNPRDLEVSAILKDRHDNSWFATFGKGVYFLPKQNEFIQHYKYRLDNPSSISADQVRAIQEDQDGDLWVGTLGKGLDRLRLNDNGKWEKVANYQFNPNDPNSLAGNRVLNIIMSPDGILWISTFNGLHALDPRTNTWKRYTYDPEDDNSLSENRVWAMDFGLDGTFWVGGFTNGLNAIDIENEQFQRFQPNPLDSSAISNKNIKTICVDQDGLVWIGTNNGLNCYNPQTGNFKKYFHEEENPYSLTDSWIWALLVDGNNNLWVATSTGLNRFDRDTERFERIFQSNGLPSNLIYDIIEDQNGNIWLSTDRGIAYLEINEEYPWGNADRYQVQTFGIQQGLGGNIFLPNANGVSPVSGHLYFGGLHGLNIINPAIIHQDNLASLLVFTGIERIDPERGELVINPFVDLEKPIQFNYKDKLIVLHFSDLMYSQSNSVEFEYQLQGASNQWIPLGDNRSIVLTNLAPGNYNLNLRNKPLKGSRSALKSSIKIRISPPWWGSPVAFGSYFLILLGMIYYFYNFQLQRQLQASENAKLKEIDTLRNRLFTNITHEFRTPLTVIRGMTDRIRGFEKEKEIIQKNNDNLLDLVNQMLDLRKIESGKMPINWVQADIIAYLKNIFASFESIAIEKNVQTHFEQEKSQLLMDFDPEKILRIFSNLLSNAIKFTPPGGSVVLSIKTIYTPSLGDEQQYLSAAIKDSGPGIPADKLPYIFDRFYQLESIPQNEHQDGSGIGLSLCKELVSVLSGTIRVKSEVSQGTIFFLELPIHQNAALGTPSSVFQSSQNPILPDLSSHSRPKEDKPELANILIVEDNVDIIEYISGLLEERYNIKVSTNGEDGVELALGTIPDLIISDVMMPKKTGFELTEILKSDERTSHIPIILLTAKIDSDSRIAGLKRGADVYLGKPFNQEELLIQIQNLLTMRKQLQKRYAKLEDLTPSQDEVIQQEDIFIQKLRSVTEEHLHDEEFGIAQLCMEVGISRSQLHKKLKALTGNPTSYFIRSIRLNRAKELLQAQDYNISQVAYQVGFKDPAYFSKTFAEHYGYRPKALLKGQKS